MQIGYRNNEALGTEHLPHRIQHWAVELHVTRR
jgi:hypothetical protein